MNQWTIKILIPLFLLLSAFSCNDIMIQLCMYMDLRINPSPIIVSENRGSFAYEIILPPLYKLRKLDSVSFNFTTEDQTGFVPLGHTVLMCGDSIQKNIVIRRKGTIAFEYEMPEDSAQLYFNVTLYSRGRSRESWKLEMAHLVKGEGDR